VSDAAGQVFAIVALLHAGGNAAKAQAGLPSGLRNQISPLLSELGSLNDEQLRGRWRGIRAAEFARLDEEIGRRTGIEPAAANLLLRSLLLARYNPHL